MGNETGLLKTLIQVKSPVLNTETDFNKQGGVTCHSTRIKLPVKFGGVTSNFYVMDNVKSSSISPESLTKDNLNIHDYRVRNYTSYSKELAETKLHLGGRTRTTFSLTDNKLNEINLGVTGSYKGFDKIGFYGNINENVATKDFQPKYLVGSQVSIGNNFSIYGEASAPLVEPGDMGFTLGTSLKF